MSSAYFSGYNRLDSSPSTRAWYQRNGYGPRAFGVSPELRGPGQSINGRNRGGGYYATGRGIYRGGYTSAGLHVGFARRSSLCWSPRRYNDYGGFCRSYFNRGCFPRRYTNRTFVFGLGSDCGWGWGGVGWGAGAWGLGYASTWPTVVNNYETENYYYGDGDSYDTYGDASGDVGAGYQDAGPADLPVLATDEGMAIPDPADYPVPSGQPSHQALGEQAFRAGDFELARREFVRAMLAKPNDPVLVMLYAYAHFATGDYLVASLAMQRALSDDPTLVDHPIDLVQFYPNADTLDAHLERLAAHRAATAGDPDSGVLYGYLQYASGHPGDAIRAFEELLHDGHDELVLLVLRDATLRAQLMQDAGTRGIQIGEATP